MKIQREWEGGGAAAAAAEFIDITVGKHYIWLTTPAGGEIQD